MIMAGGYDGADMPLQSGAQAVFSVTPAASLCQPGGQATTDHVDIKHGTATTAVAVKVTPQT